MTNRLSLPHIFKCSLQDEVTAILISLSFIIKQSPVPLLSKGIIMHLNFFPALGEFPPHPHISSVNGSMAQAAHNMQLLFLKLGGLKEQV